MASRRSRPLRLHSMSRGDRVVMWRQSRRCPVTNARCARSILMGRIGIDCLNANPVLEEFINESAQVAVAFRMPYSIFALKFCSDAMNEANAIMCIHQYFAVCTG